jgi:hypothetical protein
MANVEGKATAITVLSPVKPGWTLWLRALFFAGTHLTSSLKKLQQLSFIHYAGRSSSGAGPGGTAAEGSGCAIATCCSRATSTAPPGSRPAESRVDEDLQVDAMPTPRNA